MGVAKIPPSEHFVFSERHPYQIEDMDDNEETEVIINIPTLIDPKEIILTTTKSHDAINDKPRPNDSSDSAQSSSPSILGHISKKLDVDIASLSEKTRAISSLKGKLNELHNENSLLHSRSYCGIENGALPLKEPAPNMKASIDIRSILKLNVEFGSKGSTFDVRKNNNQAAQTQNNTNQFLIPGVKDNGKSSEISLAHLSKLEDILRSSNIPPDVTASTNSIEKSRSPGDSIPPTSSSSVRETPSGPTSINNLDQASVSVHPGIGRNRAISTRRRSETSATIPSPRSRSKSVRRKASLIKDINPKVEHSVLRLTWERLKKYLEGTKEIESHFNQQTYKEYLEFYYTTYLHYWRIMAVLASVLAAAYTAYMYYLFIEQPYNPNNIVIVNNLRPEARIGFLICGIMLVIVPLVELTFSFTPFHRRYALQAHLIMLGFYGTIISVSEYFVENTFPAQYLLLFHMVMYTSICTPPEIISYIGIFTSFVDLLAMYIRLRYNKYTPNYDNGCRSGTQDTASCAQKLAANILVYVASHSFGIYFAHLYDKYTKKTFLKNRETRKEREAFHVATMEAERIALSILPPQVWNDMQINQTNGQIGVMVRNSNLIYSYPDVTVLFGDVVGFTNLASKLLPQDLVLLLDNIFSQFDELVNEYGLEKIKTIGDCYMICAGIPERVNNQSLRTVVVGKKMVEIVKKVSKENNLDLQMRIGIHCGSALAGVLGEEKFIFDVWSKDVSIASLMEQTGKASMVHISEDIMEKCETDITFSEAQIVEYMGVQIKTYFVEDIVTDPRSRPERTGGNRMSIAARRKSSAGMSLISKVQKDMRLAMLKKVEQEELDSYMPPSGSNPQIGRWLSFKDSNLENEYQVAYIAKCTGKLAASVAFTTFMTILLTLIDVTVYTANPAVYSTKFLTALIELAVLYVIVAKYRNPDGKSPWEVRMISLSRSLNYQYIGPSAILLLFLASIPQLTISTPVMGLISYHYATLHITIMMSAVFDRLRSLHINTATYFVVILIVGNMRDNFFAGVEEDRHLAVTTWGFLILNAMTLSWITWRMEYQVRKNYLMKREIAEKCFEIEDIRIKTEKMLYTLLPKEIVQRLKENPDSIIADNIEEAAIIFCNISNFKAIDRDSMVVLNDIICKFDQALEIYQIEKIKSIGTMYMCAAGLYEDNHDRRDTYSNAADISMLDLDTDQTSKYFVRTADFALNLLQRLEQVNEKHGSHYEARIGIHIGPIVAGVIGKNKFAYDVWGDTVNVASRMESTGRPGTIQVTEIVHEKLKYQFEFEDRGFTFVKGKGDMKTYFMVKRNLY